LKDLTGYWNIYECGSCDNVFGITQETDQTEEVYCPQCSDSVSCKGDLWFEQK
jgi:DNA-directed RNA polymerase subunit RPC12/RpoP